MEKMDELLIQCFERLLSLYKDYLIRANDSLTQYALTDKEVYKADYDHFTAKAEEVKQSLLDSFAKALEI